MNNEMSKKAFMAFAAKMESLTKKHGLSVVGSWVSVPEHLIVTVCDAPSHEALMKFMMEPEVMAWQGFNVTETRPVQSFAEAAKLVK